MDLSQVLSADQSDSPTKLYFVFDQKCCHAVVVQQADSGLLLCIPYDGIEVASLHAAEETGFTEVLGPFMETTCVAATALGKQSKRMLDILLLDLDMSGLQCLFSTRPDGVQDEEVVKFGVYRGSPEWPHAGVLRERTVDFLRTGAERLEGYVTAQEGPGTTSEPVANGLGGADAQTLLEQLLAQSEITQRAVNGMKDQIAGVKKLEARLAQLETHGASMPRAPALQAADAPQLFGPAEVPLDAGQKERLRDLATRGPGKMGDLGPGSAAGLSARPKAACRVLPGGTTVDAEEEEADIDGSTLEKILASQHKLLSALVSSKTQQQDPLSILGSDSMGSEEAPRSTGVKGIAARQVLMDSFKRHPARVVALFRERLALARRKSSSQEVEPRDLWWHFQETVPLGTHKTLTHLAFISAAMFEAQERRDFARLQMLVVLQACFIEQAAYDGGSLKLAHLITCLEDPPWGQTELRKGVKMDLPHGQLSDPRWIATQLAYLRDLDGFQEKTSKYLKTPGPKVSEDATSTTENKKNPKWKPKKKQRGSQEAAEEEA